MSVAAISDNGQFDAANQVVRWGPFFDQLPRELNFQVIPTVSSSAALVFSGVASFDGVDYPISGSGTTLLGFRVSSFKVLSPGQFGLSLGEPDGRTYGIEVSTNLQTWSVLTTTTNLDGRLQFQDPDRSRAPRKFFRGVLAVP